MNNSMIEIPKCTTCGSQLHQITRDEIETIEGKTLHIKEIPIIVCATPKCPVEYYSGEVLSKMDILRSQFSLQVKNSFMTNTMEIKYPSLILRNKDSMYV